jgi:hypothetical protein
MIQLRLLDRQQEAVVQVLQQWSDSSEGGEMTGEGGERQRSIVGRTDGLECGWLIRGRRGIRQAKLELLQIGRVKPLQHRFIIHCSDAHILRPQRWHGGRVRQVALATFQCGE